MNVNAPSKRSLGPCWQEILDYRRVCRNHRKPVTFPENPTLDRRKPKPRATPTLAQRIPTVGVTLQTAPGQGDHASPKWRTQTARGFRTRRTG